MQIPSINAQMGMLGLAAVGVSLFGAASTEMSDRSRVATAGIATIFGAASAMSGFKVWAAINAGIVAGTLAGIPVSRIGADTAATGAATIRPPAGTDPAAPAPGADAPAPNAAMPSGAMPPAGPIPAGPALPGAPVTGMTSPSPSVGGSQHAQLAAKLFSDAGDATIGAARSGAMSGAGALTPSTASAQTYAATGVTPAAGAASLPPGSKQIGAYTVIPDSSGMQLVLETATQQPIGVLDQQGNLLPVTTDAAGNLTLAAAPGGAGAGIPSTVSGMPSSNALSSTAGPAMGRG